MNTYEYSRNGETLIFYKEENDNKFSFLIKDNPELTAKLLLNVSQKRIKEEKIKYAVNGIFEKLKNTDSITNKLPVVVYINDNIPFEAFVTKPDFAGDISKAMVFLETYHEISYSTKDRINIFIYDSITKERIFLES